MRASPLLLLVVSLVLLFSSVAAKSGATSFCKCICGTESQIIALNPPSEGESSSRSLLRRLSLPFSLQRRADDDKDKDKGGGDDSTKRQKTCSDCNRAFCLTYNLPKCKTLPEEEVYTQCFQRDSSKDQAVVLLFIAATVSLLGWAIVQPWVGKFVQNARERSSYAPVRGDGHE